MPYVVSLSLNAYQVTVPSSRAAVARAEARKAARASVLAGLAEERQQVLEQQFRAFLRDPVTAGEHGARDVAGVGVRRPPVPGPTLCAWAVRCRA